MKKTILFCLFPLYALFAQAQITTPVIRAGFGVDAELRANFFNGFVQSGNDDWFNNGTLGTGNFIIDTTGAAAMMARYATDVSFRKLPFFRTMRFPAFTVANNRLLIDGVFIRDYHGDDSTVFASGSNKNGMSPASWSCPVSQSIPDKNEILDMMVHVRRAGPNFTDSLWMMGGVSIENTTGNRYFDFEMYQTDIYYDRVTRQFYGYGPDAGHTSWRFDAAGNVTQPGDIIFTAEYSSSALTLLQARIWIDKASLAITPATFNWGGLFDGDGAGAQFGYASITPKTAGAFYTGLQSGNNTWPGPFGLVLGNNSMPANYVARQYMEFSVNLSKLGLDPVQLLGGNACGMPFRRVLAKTRSSTSFTSELKDFVGPFDFFLAPRAQAAADIPLFCGSYAVSNIQVTNPVSTSVYEWSTPDGNIISGNTGPSIYVDMPGTYIVTQRLQAGCSDYAKDTVLITYDPLCSLLDFNLKSFTGNVEGEFAELDWSVIDPAAIRYFELERSFDGRTFTSVGKMNVIPGDVTNGMFSLVDKISQFNASVMYYRLKVVGVNGAGGYSKVVKLSNRSSSQTSVQVFPNPVRETASLQVTVSSDQKAEIRIYDANGKIIRTINAAVQKGVNTIKLDHLNKLPNGVYAIRMMLGKELLTEKLLIQH